MNLVDYGGSIEIRKYLDAQIDLQGAKACHFTRWQIVPNVDIARQANNQVDLATAVNDME